MFSAPARGRAKKMNEPSVNVIIPVLNGERTLAQCLERLRGLSAHDALPEAMFQLGDLEVQALGSGNEGTRAAGIERLRAVVRDYGHTCWAKLAEERLKIFNPQVGPNSRPTVSP